MRLQPLPRAHGVRRGGRGGGTVPKAPGFGCVADGFRCVAEQKPFGGRTLRVRPPCSSVRQRPPRPRTPRVSAAICYRRASILTRCSTPQRRVARRIAPSPPAPSQVPAQLPSSSSSSAMRGQASEASLMASSPDQQRADLPSSPPPPQAYILVPPIAYAIMAISALTVNALRSDPDTVGLATAASAPC
eukprot:356295-Chlamydomonas_euryale.AAC.19